MSVAGGTMLYLILALPALVFSSFIYPSFPGIAFANDHHVDSMLVAVVSTFNVFPPAWFVISLINYSITLGYQT